MISKHLLTLECFLRSNGYTYFKSASWSNFDAVVVVIFHIFRKCIYVKLAPQNFSTCKFVFTGVQEGSCSHWLFLKLSLKLVVLVACFQKQFAILAYSASAHFLNKVVCSTIYGESCHNSILVSEHLPGFSALRWILSMSALLKLLWGLLRFFGDTAASSYMGYTLGFFAFEAINLWHIVVY